MDLHNFEIVTCRISLEIKKINCSLLLLLILLVIYKNYKRFDEFIIKHKLSKSILHYTMIEDYVMKNEASG